MRRDLVGAALQLGSDVLVRGLELGGLDEVLAGGGVWRTETYAQRQRRFELVG